MSAIRLRLSITRSSALLVAGFLLAIAAVGHEVPIVADRYGVLKLAWVTLALVSAAFASRSLRLTVGILLLALAIPFSTRIALGVNVHTTHVLLALLVVQLTIGISLRSYSMPRGLAAPLGVMLLGGLIASIAGPDTQGSLIRLLAGVLLPITAGVATALVIRTAGDLHLLALMSALALIAADLIGLAQASGAAPAALASVFGNNRVNGLFESPNAFGGYIAAMMLLSLGMLGFAWTRLRSAPLLLLGVALGLPALASTLSRGALLGLAVGLVLILFLLAAQRQVRPLLALLVLVVVGILAVSPSVPESKRIAFVQRFQKLSNPAAQTGRSLIYSEAVRVIGEYPLTGVGPVTFAQMAQQRTHLPLIDQRVGHAHDIFLEGYLSLGPLGLLGFAWLLAAAVVRLLRVIRRRAGADPVLIGWAIGSLGALVATMAQSVGDFLFRQPEMLILFMTIIGSAFALERIQRQD